MNLLESLAPRLSEILPQSAPPLTEAQAARYAQRARELANAVSRLDDVVAVGIAGGTGVGKSTLINALAGMEITPMGLSRPTTNSVVVYEHRETAFATRLPPDVVAVHEVRHTSEDLRRVVLIDLPDCDSFRLDHYRLLQEVLPHVDLLLLVTDPSKYGDKLFFELAASAAQAQENRLVILNKVDLLEEQYGTKAQEICSDIVEDLKAKLAPAWNGASPEVIPLSAREAFNAKSASLPVPRGFAVLQELLRSLRDTKKRIKIKRCNLDAGLNSLRRDIRSALEERQAAEKVARFEEAVNATEAELRGAFESFVVSVFTPELTARLGSCVLHRASRSWSLPARLVLRLLRVGRPWPVPESAAFEERRKAFVRRQERAALKLRRTYQRLWNQPFPQEPHSVTFSVDLHNQLEELSGEVQPKRFYPFVVAAALVLAFFVLRPAMLEAVEGLRAGQSLTRTLSEAFLSGFQSLLVFTNPLLLLLWAALLGLAYAGGVALAAFRIYSEAERRLTGLAAEVRQEAEKATARLLSPFRKQNACVRDRIQRLVSLLE